MAQHPTLPVAQPALPGLWVIHCDGSAIPNPGRMGLGASLLAPDGQQHSLSLTSSLVGCNNEAELRALIAALQHAHAQGARAVAVYSDSTLLIEQLQPPQANQRTPAPIARLAELFDSARAWLARFDSVQLQWIPRHRNSAADTLARAALGAPAKVAKHPSHKKKKR
ncbi:ribonuclease HI [Acidovorax sp. 56]|uniref:ribonuclease HI family protein n=1 Tax=Acidovorax sp. 56 TaxID=2035205 RepID=UPI000C169BD6|nr:ribonuclease HI family protein [Acidovorax sp. 56]PIF26623.1 ribonuclease HI [Acidovorax sp. 56]